MIVSRRFGNRVGWIFLGVGLVGELGLLAQGYAIYALRWSPSSLPGGSWAGLIVEVLPITVIGLGTFLLLVYPTGHLLSRRWLAVAWLSVCSTFVVVLESALGPGTLTSVSHAAKPIQVDFPLFTSGELAWSGALIAGLLAILSVVVRYRSGDAVERQQLRWFLAAVPIFVTSFYWVPSSDILAVHSSRSGSRAFPLRPASRSSATGCTTSISSSSEPSSTASSPPSSPASTSGSCSLLQQVFSGFTRGNDLAIAGSTLAVAALFRPARRRIQALRRPPLLPPALRRPADARGLQRPAARRGRPPDARDGSRRCRPHDDATGASLALAAPARGRVMSGRIAWSLFGLSAVLAAGAIALFTQVRADYSSDLTPTAGIALIVAFLVYTAVGSLIVSRHSGNRVGWIFLVAGLGVELGMSAGSYGWYAVREAPGTLPGGTWAAWAADATPFVAIGMGLLLLMLFPTGKLPSRRWRPFGWFVVLVLGVIFFLLLFTGKETSTIPGVEKPIHVELSGIPVVSVLDYGWYFLLIAEVIAVISIAVRYRNGGREERQQLRWFLAAAPIFLVSFFGLSSQIKVISICAALGVTTLPIAAGVAIFRYRLYDLDLVVRRTLVYGVLTAGLAGLYFGIVLGFQAAFSGLTRGNDLAIAGSTLAVAALFRPARRWIQSVVDRRFYRRRYDAQQTLEAFSARLRDEVDLEALGADLSGVVREALEPAHVSLWLHPGRSSE